MKKRTRLISAIASVAILCTVIPIGIFATAADDIQINGYSDLKLIGTDDDHPINGSYILTQDFTVGDVDPLKPIGTQENPFTGTFNGNGHTITNLKIKCVEPSNNPQNPGDIGLRQVGLFGLVGESGKVNNLILNNAQFSNVSTGNEFIGLLCGLNKGSITQCATVNSKIYFDQNCSLNAYIGGICGYNFGSVSKSYNTSDIIARSSSLFSTIKSGGIVGFNNFLAANAETGTPAAYGKVENCFNTGAIVCKGGTNISGTGGIVGRNNSKVSKVYNNGLVCGSTSGAIIGKQGNNDEAETNYVYYNSSSSLKAISNVSDPSGSKLNNTQLKNLSNFDELSAADWEITAGDYPYPTIKGLAYVEIGENNSDYHGGKGKIYNPYKINNTTQLSNIRKNLQSCYVIESDIVFVDYEFNDSASNGVKFVIPGVDAFDGNFYNGGDLFIPIGRIKTTKVVNGTNTTVVNNEEFTGILNGNNKSIYNLKINNREDQFDSLAGLFTINCGVIKNLTLDNVPTGDITNSINNNVYSSVGVADTGLKAYLIAADKNNIMTGACVEATSQQGNAIAATVAGTNQINGVISEVNTKANVSAIANLVGTGDLESQYAYSSGVCAVNKGLISKCKNEGSIKSNSESYFANAGGIVAFNDGYISESSNSGTIYTGFDKDITDINYFLENIYLASGGIVGKSSRLVKSGSEVTLINDCLNIGGVTNRIVTKNTQDTIYTGGIVGKGEGKISGCYYWKKSANYANEYKSGSYSTSDKDLGYSKFSAFNGCKEDSFFKLEVPNHPANGYGESGDNYYVPYLDANLTKSKCKLYSNKSETEIEIDNPIKEYNQFTDSKYVSVKTTIKEKVDTSPRQQTYEFTIMFSPIKLVVDSSKAKKIFYNGEQFDSSGLNVIAHFSNGSTETIYYGTGMTNYSVKDYDKDTTGKQTLTVKYNGADGLTIDNEQYDVHVYDTSFVFKSKKDKYVKDYSFKSYDFIAKLQYGPNDNKITIPIDYDINKTGDGYTVSPDFNVIDTSSATAAPINVTASYKGKTSTASFNIFEYPKEITPVPDSNLKVNKDNNGLVTGVEAGQTVTDIKSQVNESSFVKVYNKYYTVGDDRLVGTGYVLKLMEGSTVHQQLIIAVKGDVTAGGKKNGNGEIDIVDMMSVLSHILKKNELDGAFYNAADYSGNGEVDIVDMMRIQRKILGKNY